ncbi:rplA family protein [Pseudomonas syringae]|nr:rplA family protein [Pseudomonas syringae]PYD09554.1 rplA family protein [Pseudomonas syringae pv. syringae]
MGMQCWTLRVQSGVRGAAPLCDAERHEMHANAEHWHDSHAE